MNYVEKRIEIRDNMLVLNNLRAMFWPAQNALILSDLHIGKSKHFRKHGIPISSKVQENDLDRLSFLLSVYDPNQLIIVGDLFHSGHQDEVNIFLEWLKENPKLRIQLIKGNHDRITRNNFLDDRICIYNERFDLTPFTFIHEPENTHDDFIISGHIHPGVRIKTKGRPGITLPCFMVSKSNLVLPAFSSFTGLAATKRKKTESYHAFTESSFFEF